MAMNRVGLVGLVVLGSGLAMVAGCNGEDDDDFTGEGTGNGPATGGFQPGMGGGNPISGGVMTGGMSVSGGRKVPVPLVRVLCRRPAARRRLAVLAVAIADPSRRLCPTARSRPPPRRATTIRIVST
jgi:hypothetical protein